MSCLLEVKGSPAAIKKSQAFQLIILYKLKSLITVNWLSLVCTSAFIGLFAVNQNKIQDRNI